MVQTGSIEFNSVVVQADCSLNGGKPTTELAGS